jgi:hypothetical protein
MIRALLFLLTLATAVNAGEETPMQYLIGCLGIKKEGGKVIESWSNLVWPTILDKAPPVGPGHSHGSDAMLKIEWKDSSWKDFLAANGFQRDRLFEEPELRRLFGNSKDLFFSKSLDLPRLGLIEVSACLIEDSGKAPVLQLTIGQISRHYVRPDTERAEQAGADQPATKTADKAPVKDQPSPPTSKDAPR